MTVPVSSTSRPNDRYVSESSYMDEGDRGYGWVAFAATLLLMLGTLNFIEGIAAIGDSKFFVSDHKFIVGSLHTWGWVVLLIGVTEWIAGAGIFLKNQLARWVGVVILALNAI